MTDLPEYKQIETVPIYPPQNFKKIVKKLDQAGIELLSRMLQYDPAKRISAEMAMKHQYFKDVKLPHKTLPTATATTASPVPVALPLQPGVAAAAAAVVVPGAVAAAAAPAAGIVPQSTISSTTGPAPVQATTTSSAASSAKPPSSH